MRTKVLRYRIEIQSGGQWFEVGLTPTRPEAIRVGNAALRSWPEVRITDLATGKARWQKGTAK